MSDLVFINGLYKPRLEATVSIEDRGFRFGDGVFDTIRVCKGQLYAWNLHYKRLISGLEAIHIPLIPEEELLLSCQELIQRNSMFEGVLRITVTRGSGSRGYFPLNESRPTVVIETRPLPELNSQDIHLWVSSWVRIVATQLPTQFKLMQGMQSTLALLEAADHRCQEALLLTQEGWVSECAAANIFWFKDDVLYTPSLTTGCLGGVMRQLIIALAPYKVEEVAVPIQNILEADEVFITNSVRLVTSINRIEPIGKEFSSRAIAAELCALVHHDMDTYPLSY